MILRDWEREQRNDPGPTIMYNNYVDWWVQMQDASARMPWVNYLSSNFTSQFPNATISYGSMNGTTFIFGVNGTSTGYWSPTRSRTTKIYNGVTTTLEEKFTYHCPGEVEMSSSYILSINLNSGFWDPSLETRELDNTLSLGELMFAAGKGISQSQINSGIKALQKSGKGSLPYFSKGGRFLGWINAGTDFIDFAGQPTWGNGVKVGLDVATIYVP